MSSLSLGSSSFVLAFLSALSGLAAELVAARAPLASVAALVTVRSVWLLLSAGGSKLSAQMSLHGHQLQQLQQQSPLLQQQHR